MITSSGDATQHQLRVAKLPQIQLSEFDGKFTEWIALIDQLDTVVHLKTKLSKSQHFFYLKKCLSGLPEKLIKTYHQLTSIEQRYKNNCIILRILQARAVDLKPVRGQKAPIFSATQYVQ